jgi:hypothetical protein
VISGSYTKGSVKNGKKDILESSIGDKITIHGYRAQTSTKCTIVIIVVLTVTRGHDLNKISWLWLVMGGMVTVRMYGCVVNP